MIHILKKIADWIVENEKKEATDCSISDEIIDEWLETIEEHKNRMKKNRKTETQQYEMLQDLDKKVKEIEDIRKKKCHIESK
ncbi:MAG: hypothetical protein P794_08065 [Epsilonproteobacteria bacterium (ex Lamellibrachia satsuma)]|nr:MAG: hypothetical protein P794_08065 [Epsilonproteobacteria bacterium (ex Lamellibrachia satsuma)]